MQTARGSGATFVLDLAGLSRDMLIPLTHIVSAPPRAMTPSMMAGGEIYRVLVCVGHLCECQPDGAQKLLKELDQNPAFDSPVEETVCLGMCGMGAMGCVEYADGSEELTMGREHMLSELNLDAAPAKVVPESCAVEEPTGSNVQRILVCTGRVCAREKGGGTLLLEALQRDAPSLPCEAAPCMGTCGQGSLMQIEYADGCEETVSSNEQRLSQTLERLGIPCS